MVHPIGDRILVKRDDTTQIIKSIYIPVAYQEKADTGTVMSVGIKETDIGVVVPMGVEVNDHVVFQKGMGTELKINDKECVLLESYDVFAIIE